MQSSKHDVPRFWRGCFVVMAFWLVIAIVVAVACRVRAQPGTAVYIQHVIYRPNTGVAWCSGCPDNATKLNAYFWYGCCTTCPTAHGARLAIIRPGWQWSSDCPADYNGHILQGNENEFTMTPQAMANWLISQRAIYQDATFVCLNSYDLQWAADVIALLPPDTCEIYGAHIYDDVDVGEHLSQMCTGCRLWITELGACGSGAYERLKRQIEESRRYGVERVFGYTAVNGVSPCLDMIDSNGDLTLPGLGFTEGLASYP